MDEEHPANSGGTLYEPIVFVYTETIGEKKAKKKEVEVRSYGQKYQDILIPQNQSNRVLHYLFHIAPIYNWLRSLQPMACPQREELAKYIEKQKQVQRNKQNNPILQQTKTMKQTLYGHYAQKWEVVKLCLKNKLLVQSVGDVQGSHLLCRHYLKAEIWSQFYSYDFKRKEIVSDKFYCKQCDGIVKAEVEIKEIAWAPLFQSFFGEQLLIKGQKYILTQYYTDTKSAVRAANKLWYQRESPSAEMKICSGALQTSKNQKGIFVYAREKMFEQCGILRPARALKAVKESIESKKDNSKQIKLSDQNKQSPNKIKQGPKIKAESLNKQASNSEELEVIDKIRGGIVGNVLPEYQESVLKLYEKEKEKDQYEKDYDKGKTKKIKKKHDYLKPDFNEIFKQVKARKPEEQEEHYQSLKFGKKRFQNRQGSDEKPQGGKKPFRSRHDGFSNPGYRVGHQRRRHDEARFKKKWNES